MFMPWCPHQFISIFAIGYITIHEKETFKFFFTENGAVGVLSRRFHPCNLEPRSSA
jgi:hypothetical protein